MFLSCSSVCVCVRLCVHPETLLTNTISCKVFYTCSSVHQTYINDALWDSDERVIIWGQKVKGGDSGIKYAGNTTFWACFVI